MIWNTAADLLAWLSLGLSGFAIGCAGYLFLGLTPIQSCLLGLLGAVALSLIGQRVVRRAEREQRRTR